MFPIIGLSALLVVVTLHFTQPSGPSSSPKGVVLVTLAFVHVYNQCIGHQLALKMPPISNSNPVLSSQTMFYLAD